MKKTMKKGFTIVELLIVIVVIGILASIVVVTYNGVQKRTKTQAAEVLAKEIKDKAEVYNADMSSYPTVGELLNPVDESGEAILKTAKLSPKGKKSLAKKILKDDGSTDDTKWSKNKDKILYRQCEKEGTVIGAVVSYYDYSTDKESTKKLYAGECEKPTTNNKITIKDTLNVTEPVLKESTTTTTP